MYKSVLRPILFKLYPETVHHLVVKLVKTSFKIPGIPGIVGSIYTYKNPVLETKFLGLLFPNKVGLAAGFDKDATFYNEFSRFGFGHIEIGTVTPKPQPGNDKPRLFRLPKDKALINRMGFNNLGVDEAVERLKRRKTNIVIGGNIGKNTATPNEKAVDDYVYCFEKLYDYVDYFVVNVSCPNITDLHELQDKDNLKIILKALIDKRSTKNTKKPVLLKISPDLNFNQVDDTLDIATSIGIDGLVVTNTTITRDNLTTDKQLVDNIGRGGMSGKPIKERSTRMIQYISDKTNKKMPIIGVGGIMSAEDALDKIKAGASLVQVYTGFIYEGPIIAKKINKALANMK